jgi:hypothetical protein
MKINKEYVISKEELEKVFSKIAGVDLKIDNFYVQTSGDYDAGNYKEELTKIVFKENE